MLKPGTHLRLVIRVALLMMPALIALAGSAAEPPTSPALAGIAGILPAHAPNSPGTNHQARSSRRIVLGPDDKPVFPLAPAGFDKRRDGAPRGAIEKVVYKSTTVGTNRAMLVYTPPGFSRAAHYPVLYLLHGVGGDEREWQRKGASDVILDNLIAGNKAVPMLVVMPNGRAQIDDRAVGNVFLHGPAFQRFENDLLKDIIPFIEAKYPARRSRESRAIAGLSIGGGQALNIGLAHLDTFAWVGAFSPAPNTRLPENLVPNPAETSRILKLLWLSCGDQDGLINVSQRTHLYLKDKRVPHIWHVEPGRHDFEVWKNDIYWLLQNIFVN